MIKSRKKCLLLVFLATLIAGYLIPQNFVSPVEGADKRSFNQRSFWYDPWGTSGTHKGVDIFAEAGTNVKSATGGLVLYAGTIEKGGNVILVLGPKWRLHYYAHLKT